MVGGSASGTEVVQVWLRGIGLYGAMDGSKFSVNVKVWIVQLVPALNCTCTRFSSMTTVFWKRARTLIQTTPTPR